MPSRRNRPITRFARHSYGLALAAPEVIAHRLTRLWLAGATPSHRDREEFYRMSAEKVAAFYDSWNAMFREMFRANLQLAFSPMWWWAWLNPTSWRAPGRLSAQGRRTISAIWGAGLAPIHQRAAANAKRLRLERLKAMPELAFKGTPLGGVHRRRRRRRLT
jgi:hypothetical protein